MTWSRRRIAAEDAPAHFWSRVSKGSGCWLWMGAKVHGGYGHLSYLGRSSYAHRMAWELTNGPIPDGLVVCHRCDNPSCCRPEHLFVGTQSDNLFDMAEKRRRQLPFCKRGHCLTDDQMYFTKEGRRHACMTCTREAVNRRYADWIASGRTPAEWKARKRGQAA